MKQFDLLLVLGYFRSATAYLSIIRHLPGQMRIGVMPVPNDYALEDKTGPASALFLSLCQRFGAELVTPGEPVITRLMIVQQFRYNEAAVSRINASVTASRRTGLMTLAMAGLEVHDRYLDQFVIQRIYVPSRRFMEFLLERRSAAHRYSKVEIEEVGLPYRQYPVFPEFSADWLIAAPTLFSFSSERSKHAFLRTVQTLMSQMPPTDVVAYKPHNGTKRDYFSPRLHYRLASAARLLRVPEELLDFGEHPAPIVGRHAERTLTGMLHQRVLDRAVPMSMLTPYADLSLEAFLPGVRKGVIGGLSNTTWGTLYFGLPYLNCVDPALDQRGYSALLGKTSAELLDLNLQYFGVPFCGGDLARGARGEHIVGESDRRGDLMRAVLCDAQVDAGVTA